MKPLLLALLLGQQPASDEELGLKVAPGFRVTLFSGPEIANDIYAMTLDPRGRVVVASQGWIKTLHDDNGDGRADRATLFAKSATGAMGLCFDGNDLLYFGDGGLNRLRDGDADGVADGPAERILSLSFGEHGGHAMRKGPDGAWYFIGGNDSGIDKLAPTLPDSPVRKIETGAIMRFTPDLKQFEVVAHGFRNPYDFDFNAAGDLFTYDSDCERDFFLPWYTPTRIYHVGHAMHHGWRLRGYQRSFARLDHYPDTVDILWPVGRGSPTGVASYRHHAFPARYRDGLFALDWTFGKVYFLPLTRSGASYTTTAEVFLEPIGTEGFAPTDAVVAPDGALLVSIGGRRTRGAIYRVEPVEIPKAVAPASDLDAVLAAPQPLDAWSRARWEPVARKLGAGPFVAAALEERRDIPQRVRAIEVLTELFGGLPPAAAKPLATSAVPLVRARAAWSLGRSGPLEPLYALAEDLDPRVCLRAFEALADRFKEIDPNRVRDAIAINLAHREKRIRQAVSRLAALLPEDAWKTIETDLTQGRLTQAFAALSRGSDPVSRAVETALSVEEKDLRLQAVRLIVLALGDCNLDKPSIDLYANYSLPGPVDATVASSILTKVRLFFPSSNARLNLETSRLLAMLEDDDPKLPAKVAAFWTAKSHPTEDLHYLIVYSRLRGTVGPELVARALVGLNQKLDGLELRTKQTWGDRLKELFVELVRRDPRVADEALRLPDFVNPAHVVLAESLEGDRRLDAARRFLAAARDPKFAWSEPLIALLSRLPADEFLPALRTQWSNLGLRDAILPRLPHAAEDREKFLWGAESSQPAVVRASLDAMEKLPRDETPRNLVPLLRLLRRLALEPKEAALRARVLALIERQSGRPGGVKDSVQPLLDAFAREHPDLAAELSGGGEDPAAFAALLKSVAWEEGDAARGEELFRARGCQTCHAVQGALGPALGGAARRFSREDLFGAIASPSRDVAPLYRPTIFDLRDGQVFTGVVVFLSADGYIVQTGATTTARIAAADVASMRPGALSLMPEGLLKGLAPRDLADLYRYLQGLK